VKTPRAEICISALKFFPLPVVDKSDRPTGLEIEVMPEYEELEPSNYCRRDLSKSCVYADGYTPELAGKLTIQEQCF